MIRLLPLTADAAPLVLSWAEDERLSEYFRHFPPRIEWSQADKMLQVFTHTYLVALDSELIGLVGFSQVNTAAKSVDMGFMLAHKHLEDSAEVSWKVGLEMLKYVFEDLRYHRATCRVLTHRVDLKKRIESYGWKLEGTLKQSCYYRGEYCDEALYAITRDEYCQGLAKKEGVS